MNSFKLGRFLVAVLRPIYFLVFPYKIHGAEHIPPENGEPCILCPNHISNLDPVVLMCGLKRPIYFMAKAELFRNRLTAWLFTEVFGAFPVNRGKGDTTAVDTAVELVKEGKLFGIFPEGTRSTNGQLLRAKSGVSLITSRTGALVIPVAIKTKNQQVRPFRMTHVIVGEPMTPEELHLTDPEHPDLRYSSRKIMERIRQLMEESI